MSSSLAGRCSAPASFCHRMWSILAMLLLCVWCTTAMGDPDATDTTTATGLSDEDATLLELGSVMRFRDKLAVPPLAGDVWDPILAEAKTENIDDKAKLAGLIVLANRTNETYAQLRKEQQQQLNQLPGLYYDLAIKGLFAGLTQQERMSFSEFREGPGSLFEAWGDDLRRTKIQQTIAIAANAQLYNNITALAERLYAPKYSAEELAYKKLMTLTPFDVLKGDQFRRGNEKWAKGVVGARGVILRYRGATPLTNVMVITHIKTNGTTTALTDGQLNVLGINAAFDYGDKNDDVSSLFMAQNLVGSMPHSGYGFLREIKKGEMIHYVLPDITDSDKFLEQTVTLYCDQGRVSETVIKRGKAKEPKSVPNKSRPAKRKVK